LIKPDIVFFGEGLPARFHNLLQHDLKKADLILVMGSSLMVAPVSQIPTMVTPHCRRVLFNRELVGNFTTTTASAAANTGTTKKKPARSQKKKKRVHPDLFSAGDIDTSVRKLCRLLGWEHELDTMHNTTSIDTNTTKSSNTTTGENL